MAEHIYTSGEDARTLRDALGCFATGITVISALSASGEPAGLTANSFTSVSLDPPLLLVCIAKTSTALKTIEAVEHFAVNVLCSDQQAISMAFARPMEDRFSEVDWTVGHHGTPILSGALANFECARHDLFDGGDHIILIGRVERATYDTHGDPLLYYRGLYRRLNMV